MDVFGDGHEYDWALEGDDEYDIEGNEEQGRPQTKYVDVSISEDNSLTTCINYVHQRFSNPLSSPRDIMGRTTI